MNLQLIQLQQLPNLRRQPLDPLAQSDLEVPWDPLALSDLSALMALEVPLARLAPSDLSDLMDLVVQLDPLDRQVRVLFDLSDRFLQLALLDRSALVHLWDLWVQLVPWDPLDQLYHQDQ